MSARCCDGPYVTRPDQEARVDSAVDPASRDYDFDFIIVGSGFGGNVSALRLSEKGYRVGVLEMGRRWSEDELPRTTWNLKRWLWQPALGLRGLFRIRLFSHVMVLHGHAVGGGSIAYANTLMEPPDTGGKAVGPEWRLGTR